MSVAVLYCDSVKDVFFFYHSFDVNTVSAAFQMVFFSRAIYSPMETVFVLCLVSDLNRGK